MTEPSRRILLCEMLDGPRTVGQLVESTGLKQPNVSNHLAKLREREIVQALKVGRQVFYSLQGHDIEVVVRNLIARPEEQEVLPLDQIALRIARAAVAGDDETAVKLADQAMRTEKNVIGIYDSVFSETFRLIGTWFEVQAIDVAQEHLATAILERLMTRVIHFAPVPPVTGPTAILACVPENYHTVGLRMLNDCLRMRGWHTLFLGANVPLTSLLTRIEQERPKLVLLSVATADQLPHLADATKQITQLRAKHELSLRIGVGGQPLHLAEAKTALANADFTARSVAQFNELVPTLT